MRCWYCHNEHILDTKDFLDEEEVLSKIAANATFLDGVVITGGEPTLQSDLAEFIKKIKQLGLLVKLDTNGKRPDALEELLKTAPPDYIAMDVKAPLDDYYKATPQTAEKAEVFRKSIKLIMQSGIPHEFRTTVIPQLSVLDIEKIAKEIEGAQAYYLQQYNDKKGIKPHPASFFSEAKDAASRYVPTYVRGI